MKFDEIVGFILGAIGLAVAGAAVVVLIAAIMSLPVWILWNWLIPIIFNGAVPTLTWFQSWGLMVLCSFLFKSSSSTKKD